MNKIKFYLLLIVVIIFSCKTEEINAPILVYSINRDAPENYILNSKNERGFNNFEYVSTENQNVKYDFKYFLEKDLLLLGSDTLYPIKSIYKPKDLEFKMYQIRKKRSHIRTFVFNEDYGLLANIGFKSHNIFLKDSVTFLEKESIFKGIFLELNKTHIIK